jgi:hypothetical protein
MKEPHVLQYMVFEGLQRPVELGVHLDAQVPSRRYGVTKALWRLGTPQRLNNHASVFFCLA